MLNIQQNNLGAENSPYLRQHAHNPVWWQAYGQETIRSAKNLQKLIIVSIGYSACHWCHVMEKESFADENVAAVMNARYLSIKLDREERPDLDHVYMQAAMLSSRQGGWPLNAICLPDGRPFFAGTYFPRERWLAILHHFYGLWKTEPSTLIEAADAIQKGIAKLLSAPSAQLDAGLSISEALQEWKTKIYRQLDPDFGGPDREPRFPMPSIALPFLSDNQPMAERVKTWLLRMAAGGIYDQAGGGFARYSTDKYWFLPHFEKMLYDNAQLLEVYALAYHRTPHPVFLRTLQGIIQWVSRDLALPDGRYQSAIDADSEGQEGAYYVWTPESLPALSPQEWSDFQADFEWKAEGNWEGKTILWRPERWASPLLPNTESALVKLEQVRRHREAPNIDSKVLLGWNALYLRGLTSVVFGVESLEAHALKAAEKLGEALWTYRTGESLWLRCLESPRTLPAFLDDLAPLGLAFTQLHQATGNSIWLERSIVLAQDILNRFSLPNNPLLSFSTQADPVTQEHHVEIQDNVVPSANSMAARFFLELGVLSGKREYQERARAMLTQVFGAVQEAPMWHSGWVLLAEMLNHPIDELRYHAEATAARGIWRKRLRPPFLIQDSSLPPGQWQVCRGTQCLFPAGSTDELLQNWPEENQSP